MLATSPVDWRVLDAKDRTSSATTANPRPASPARAASIAAFNANRLVCSAMLLITSIIPAILSESPFSWESASAACVISSDSSLIVLETLFTTWLLERTIALPWVDAWFICSNSCSTFFVDSLVSVKHSFTFSACCFCWFVADDSLLFTSAMSSEMGFSRITEDKTDVNVLSIWLINKLIPFANSASSSLLLVGRRWVKSPSPSAMSYISLTILLIGLTITLDNNRPKIAPIIKAKIDTIMSVV